MRKVMVLMSILVIISGCFNEDNIFNKTKRDPELIINSITINEKTENYEVEKNQPYTIEIDVSNEIYDVKISANNGSYENGNYSIGDNDDDIITVEIKDRYGNVAKRFLMITGIGNIDDDEFNGTTTFILYLAGDNNLNGGSSTYYDINEDFAKQDIQDIIDADINSDKINVVVYKDLYNRYFNTENQGIYVKEGNQLVKKEGKIFGNNTGDYNTLQGFLDYVGDNYPADRYILSLWGHGDGWLDDGNKTRPAGVQNRAIGYDYSSGHDALNLWELESAIKNSLGKIDIILFDACLMGTIEVAYQLKDVSDYLAFSPEFVPGPGAPYKEMLEWLSDNNNKNNRDVAINIQRVNFESYEKGGSQNYVNGLEEVVYSVVDQSKCDDLIEQLNEVSNELLIEIEANENLINKIRDQVLFYNRAYGSINPTKNDYYIDLGSLLKAINSEIENVKIDNFIKILEDEYVINLDYQDGDFVEEKQYNYSLQGTTGLSIYFNLFADFTNANYRLDSYKNASSFASSFAKDTNWVNFIEAYSN